MRKLIAYITAAVLSLMLISPTAQASSLGAGYAVEGEVSGEELTLTVSLREVEAYAGRLALKFDAAKLRLKEEKFTKAIESGPGITITTEGQSEEELISQEKGYVMFAWYPTTTSVDARETEKEIAKISFYLQDGVSENDFTRNTIGLRYTSEGMYDKWSSGAQIIGKGMVNYTATARKDENVCHMSYAYPNSDYVPVTTYKAEIKAQTISGEAISGARVEIDDLEQETDESGQAVFELESGVYGYRVTAEGYDTKSGYIKVEEQDVSEQVLLESEEEMVQSAAKELEIVYNSGDSDANITSGIGLKETSENGCEINWISSRRDVITEQGIVHRQKEDVNVTLTAVITRGRAQTRKAFYVTVKSRKTAEEYDQESVEADAENLEVIYAPGDSGESVTGDITLKTRGENGSAIVWESSDESVIDSYGEVTRSEADREVRLIATIMRNSASVTKSFNVTVKAARSAGYTDEEAVNVTMSSLSIGYAYGDRADRVTGPLMLASQGTEGVEIQWLSSHPSIVTGYGGVVRQHSDVTVTLTATAKRGKAEKSASFTVTVKAMEVEILPDTTPAPGQSDEERVKADCESLKITYAPGDRADRVTSNISLPIAGESGSVIFWKSSDSDAVSIYGEVNRGASDKHVKLTAAVTRGNVSKSKEFEITVKESNVTYESDEDIVNRVTEALEIGYASGDSAEHVTKSVTLPMQGAMETGIEWRSSNTSVITNNGGVTRKTIDMPVTLVATVARNGARSERSFDVLVVSAESDNVASRLPEEEKVKPLETVNPTETIEKKPSRFTDIESVAWAKEAIEELAKQGIISGTSASEFSPQNPIRRADFVTLLMRLLKLDGEITDSFADVTRDKYYYDTVSRAKTLGIISGLGENKFDPEGSITRQDMMVMTHSALEKLGKIDTRAKADLAGFADETSVSDYARESVGIMVGNGLITGDESRKLNPKKQTTRAEAAVYLYQIYAG